MIRQLDVPIYDTNVLFLLETTGGEVAGGIVLVLMMILGIYLWKKGLKENNKKE